MGARSNLDTEQNQSPHYESIFQLLAQKINWERKAFLRRLKTSVEKIHPIFIFLRQISSLPFPYLVGENSFLFILRGWQSKFICFSLVGFSFSFMFCSSLFLQYKFFLSLRFGLYRQEINDLSSYIYIFLTLCKTGEILNLSLNQVFPSTFQSP